MQDLGAPKRKRDPYPVAIVTQDDVVRALRVDPMSNYSRDDGIMYPGEMLVSTVMNTLQDWDKLRSPKDERKAHAILKKVAHFRGDKVVKIRRHLDLIYSIQDGVGGPVRLNWKQWSKIMFAANLLSVNAEDIPDEFLDRT